MITVAKKLTLNYSGLNKNPTHKRIIAEFLNCRNCKQNYKSSFKANQNKKT